MKVWKIAEYARHDFARAILPDDFRTQSLTTSRVTIEWEPGSDLVADFTFPTSTMVVKEDIAEELKSRFSGFEIQSVEMVQNPKLKRPKRITKRTRPRIWLPYTGPRLAGIRPTVSVKADPSRWPLVHVGPGDASVSDGLEFQQMDFQRYLRGETGEDAEHRVPRDPAKGYFFPRDTLSELDLFRVFNYGMRMSDGTCQLRSLDRSRHERGIDFIGGILCKDNVKTFLESKNYSNLTFLEYGEEY